MMRMRTVCLILLLCIPAAACQGPPEDELEAAQRQIDAARKAEAEFYSPDLLRAAEDLLSEASLKISEKSYSQARKLATEARAKARQAEQAAQERQVSEKQRGVRFLSDARRRVAELKARIDGLAIAEQEGARGKLLEKLQQVEPLLQLYKSKLEEGRMGEARNLESTIQQLMLQVNNALDSIMNPDKAKEETLKKR